MRRVLTHSARTFDVADVRSLLCDPQVKEQLAQSLFDHIPVGVGSQGIIPTTAAGLEAALQMGMDWCDV